VASRLVLDAQASIAHSGRRFLDMSVDLAFDQLRHDVRSSDGFGIPAGMGGLWVRGERLTLVGHISGDTVIYELRDGELLRHSVPLQVGQPTATRPVLRDVRVFRYRSVPTTGRPSLEVEVTHFETAPLTARTSAGQAAAAPAAERVVGLILTPRYLDRNDPVRWW
ncbi:MAG: hypothetical protein AAGF23_16435, partial [Acidobacteriota bacterium]